MMVKKIIILIGMTVLAASVTGVDDPHGSTNSISCEECHINHASMGDILINATDSLVSTLCLSCHTPGGWVGMTKTMSSSLIAVPGVSGTSHAWDVDTDNAASGAAAPTSQTLLDHLTKEGKITCATCHDPHKNTTSPFLRMDNSADQLCLDCHSPRNQSSVKTYTGDTLSHPIGAVLPSASDTYHNPPLDTDGNPQPSDGNTTNDFVLGAGDTIKCTSCHGIHYTDSNSGTVDGP